MSACYCCRPDRNCEKCRAQADTYKLGGGGVVELWYRLGGRSGMLVADGYQEMADTFADNMVELHTALKEHMHE